MTVSSGAPTVVTGASRPLPAWRAALGSPVVGIATVIVGAVVLVVAGMLPVWGTRLIAPQYPSGLDLWFYGGRVEGPVSEVNNLNHYIGLNPIDLSSVPEMQLWPLAVVSAVLFLALAVLWRGPISRLALLALWLIPVVVLADIQRWLIIFSTELVPGAPLSLDGFIPLVVGPSQVWNFTVLTYPGAALILIWVVALVAIFARRSAQPDRRGRWLTLGAAMAIGLVGTLALVLPTMDLSDDEEHEQAGVADAPPAASLDLQGLVAEAPAGSTVTVPTGRYLTHLVIDRPLTLAADGDVLLDGGGRGSVVTITADDVILRGFRVANTGGQVEDAAAIKVVDASGVTVADNRLERFFTGIAALGASELHLEGNVLQGSGQVAGGAEHAVAESGPTAAPESGHTRTTDPHAGHGQGDGPGGQGDGISLWNTRAATIVDNTIRDVRDALYLNYVDGVLVDTNDIRDSRYAIHSMSGSQHTVFGNHIEGNISGLVFMYTRDVLAGRNVVVDQRAPHTGYGVVLKDVEGVRLAENVIARNRIALKAEGTRPTIDREAVVLRNRFSSNATAVELMASADLGFGANVFEGNLVQVHAVDQGVERSNDWTYQGTGNTWEGYAGYDLDGDGVGDVPHTEGGVLPVIVESDPLLEVYRTSPALHLLGTAQEIWEAGRPAVVEDRAPRLAEYAPLESDLVATAGVGAGAADPVAWYAAGISLILLTALGVGLARLRRRAGVGSAAPSIPGAA